MVPTVGSKHVLGAISVESKFALQNLNLRDPYRGVLQSSR